MIKVMNTNEYIQGMKDCRDGIPHVDKSESYTKGYNAQYELEQMNTELNIRQNNEYNRTA